MLYSDAPYGMTDAEWDEVWSAKKLDKILKQFGASNTSEYCVAVLWHNPVQGNEYIHTLKANDYQEPVRFYWHKTAHHTPTHQSSYTSAVEQCLITFRPNKTACPFNVEANPRLRHNFIECPSVRKYYLDEKKEIINKCQKPPELSRKLAQNHCIR